MVHISEVIKKLPYFNLIKKVAIPADKKEVSPTN